MKRLILSVLALGMIIGFNGCDEKSENLQICGIEYGKQGAYFKPTIQDFIDTPHIEISDKYNNKIATFHDDRGTPLFDFIMQKVKIENKPSCYVVADMFIYQKNKNVPRDGIFFFLKQNYGTPTDIFALDTMKQEEVK